MPMLKVQVPPVKHPPALQIVSLEPWEKLFPHESEYNAKKSTQLTLQTGKRYADKKLHRLSFQLHIPAEAQEIGTCSHHLAWLTVATYIIGRHSCRTGQLNLHGSFFLSMAGRKHQCARVFLAQSLFKLTAWRCPLLILYWTYPGLKGPGPQVDVSTHMPKHCMPWKPPKSKRLTVGGAYKSWPNIRWEKVKSHRMTIGFSTKIGRCPSTGLMLSASNPGRSHRCTVLTHSHT